MNLQDDDFTLFDLPRRQALDVAVLDQRWKALQGEVHPDRFVAQGAAAQRVAMQWAVRVNEAWQRLKDPLRRAALLCELGGVPIDAQRNTAMPGEFLAQQMQWREALEEATDPAALEAVAGGGDTAAEEALFLSRFASKVYLIHRRDQLRATKVLQERILAHDRIEPVWNSVITEVLGENSGVTGLALTDPQGGNRRTLEVAGLFVAIGVVPKAHFLAGILDLDAEGYILTDAECRTSMPGVFAAGDVRKKILKQIATAVGDGAVAAIVAEKYLDEPA